MKLLEVKNITKTFGSIRALNNVSISINAGDCYGMIGPNGSGKTTFISIVLSLLKPDSGEVTHTLGDDWKYSIGYVSDKNTIADNLTLVEFLWYFAQLYRVNKTDFENRLSVWLDIFELTEHKGRLVQNFSLGMKRKAQIIASVLHKPKLLIIDEPTNALDPSMIILLKKAVKSINKLGITIFISTHHLSLAEDLCNRIAVIHHGEILIENQLDKLLDITKSVNLESAYQKLVYGLIKEDVDEKIFNTYQ